MQLLVVPKKVNRGPSLTPEGLQPWHPRRSGRNVGNVAPQVLTCKLVHVAHYSSERGRKWLMRYDLNERNQLQGHGVGHNALILPLLFCFLFFCFFSCSDDAMTWI
jgi:hypothetical protein